MPKLRNVWHNLRPEPPNFSLTCVLGGRARKVLGAFSKVSPKSTHTPKLRSISDQLVTEVNKVSSLAHSVLINSCASWRLHAKTTRSCTFFDYFSYLTIQDLVRLSGILSLPVWIMKKCQSKIDHDRYAPFALPSSPDSVWVCSTLPARAAILVQYVATA